MSDPVTIEQLEDGAYWRVVIGGSKGNILNAAAMAPLTAMFREAANQPQLKAICLEGQGSHFSFGASVPEHMPDQVHEMFRAFRELLFALIDSSVMTLAAVRGQCLGGGLELVTLCHRLFAAPGAAFGQPEIVLGVFAPAASVLLADKVGRGAAEDLCLSGRSIDASEAHRLGLADEIAADPSEAAHAYVRAHLLPRSASSLRYAVRAVRLALRTRLANELSAVEALYLNELMATADAVEGLRAFVDRRAPSWGNR